MGRLEFSHTMSRVMVARNDTSGAHCQSGEGNQIIECEEGALK